MTVFERNKEKFDEVLDFYNGFKEYGYIFCGYREDELLKELDSILKSIETCNEILKDNFEC